MTRPDAASPVPARPLALCLLNPHAAGGRGAALAPALQAALHAADPALPPLQRPDSVAEATARIAALAPGRRVLLAGGDGTLQRLLPALVAGGHELLLLPCGTGNDLARALGGHRAGWRGTLAAGLHAPAQPMDLGTLRADGGAVQWFASSLTAGFDAAVAQQAMRAPGWLRGMPRYLVATLATLATLAPHRLALQADGQALAGGEHLFASVLNTPSYASGMPVAPGARIDDGALDLVQAGRFGRLGALLAMPLLLTGWHGRHPRIRLSRCRQLVVQAQAPLPLALDGEPIAPACRLEVAVAPAALRVVRT